jgi:hypothetical protein
MIYAQLNVDNDPRVKNLALGMSLGHCCALAAVPTCLTAGPDSLAGVGRVPPDGHMP